MELSKHKAPSIGLLEFNYFFNKTIYQYINKRYNIYDINQQTSDDVRVLKSSAILEPVESSYATYGGQTIASQITRNSINSLYGATYEVDLPSDYLHILNCVCVFQLTENWQCYDKGSFVQFGATRLTSDAWSTIINDFYNRPLPTRPYFYLHNINSSATKSGYHRGNNLPTNPYNVTTGKGTDWNNLTEEYDINNNTYITQEDGTTSNLVTEDSTGDTVQLPINLSDKLKIAEGAEGTIRGSQSVGGVRYGNATKVRMEIRCGKDNSVFKLIDVIVDYIKTPQHIRLTQEQIDMIKDTSQIMEFPDYVCQEIINELVHAIMENTADPRLQTHIPISTSIAQPAHQQTAAQAE